MHILVNSTALVVLRTLRIISAFVIPRSTIFVKEAGGFRCAVAPSDGSSRRTVFRECVSRRS